VKKGKVVRAGEVCDKDLRIRIEEVAGSEKGRQTMVKDVHLIEAA